jgi:hypothetical protein
MHANEKDGCEQPEEGFWVHGGAEISAMDMPQRSVNENEIFYREKRRDSSN